MTDILIQGIAGRMGHALCALIAQRQDCRVAAGVDRAAADIAVPVFPTLAACTQHADVLIDFSNPDATDAALDECVRRSLPCVICTTGLAAATQDKLLAASKQIPVFQSANMSLGVNVLIQLAKRASAILGPAYDVEIIEKHHHNKLDAPSGTALMIAYAIRDASETPYTYMYDRHELHQKRAPAEIGIHSVRGGTIVGEHDVLFCGPDEVLTLSHSAASRDVFANGAINAALFLAGRKAGLYTMEDLIAL